MLFKNTTHQSRNLDKSSLKNLIMYFMIYIKSITNEKCNKLYVRKIHFTVILKIRVIDLL